MLRKIAGKYTWKLPQFATNCDGIFARSVATATPGNESVPEAPGSGSQQPSLTVPAPKWCETPLTVPERLLTGPGPSNASERVLKALSLPLLGHLHPETLQIMDDIKSGIQYAFQTKNSKTFAVSGTGHAAMETVVFNLVRPGDVILTAVNGLWGERFANLVTRNGAKSVKILRPYGEVFTPEEIEAGLRKFCPKLLFVTHGESSGTTCQNLEDVGQLCRKYGALLAVDAVASMGAKPVYMDTWGVDVLYSGSQKVLSCPPGPSPVSFSDRAWEMMTSQPTPCPSFYLDAQELAAYWGCVAGSSGVRKYHHTCMISNLYALREGLAGLCQEGLQASWRRHGACADLLYRGLGDLDLDLLVPEVGHRLGTVTGVWAPPGVEAAAVSRACLSEHGVEISGGLGSLAGRIWRVGLMGQNAQTATVSRVLSALSCSLRDHGYRA